MVPDVYFVVTQLPITVSGKTDRKRLREIGASFSAQQLAEIRTSGQGLKRQPSTENEKALQQLWAGVLAIDADSIGLDDSFFRLGGDSIAAMKLVGEARRAGIHLTVADLFRNPKLEAVASLNLSLGNSSPENIVAFALLGETSDVTQIREEVAASCNTNTSLIEDIYPCSPLQEGMMALASKRPGDYIMQSVLALHDDTDEDRFRAAWERVVQSTAVLRTRIVHSSKMGMLQVVLADGIEWEQANELEQYLEKDKSVSMGLGDSLARYALVRDVGTGKRWMVWTLHHALYDGWSLPQIANLVTEVYHGAEVGKQPGFNAFIKYLGEQDHEAAAAYWQGTLADCQAISFPALPPAVQQPVADATTAFQCPALARRPSDITMSTLIRAAWALLASSYTSSDDVVFGATVTGRNAPVAGIEAMAGPTIATVPVRFVVLLAAFRATHFRLTGQEDATIGTPNANRDRWEVKDMVGFFVNMQCLRIKIGDESFEELVQQVHEVAVASHANADVPFENIVSKLKNDRDLSRHPLVQLVFAVHAQRDLGQLKLETLAILDAMPVNQNGKVDRKALEQQIDTQKGQSGLKRQPETETQRTMQQLWAGVLAIDADSIGLDDSFFRLGGDSIAAMKLVGEARRAGIHLTVADLFRNPKLEAVASLNLSNSSPENIVAFALLGETSDVTQIREEVAASCNTNTSLIEDIYPCSPLQEGMMALASKRPGDYIMQSVLALHDDTDEDRFRAAWERVVQSTAVLRTRIVHSSKMGMLQVVLADGIEWEQANELEQYLEKDKSVSMGLGDSLARYALVRDVGTGKRWMVWTLHHALYDGWSLPQIANLVTEVYHGAEVGKQPGFNAFIKYLGEQDHEAAAAYWQAWALLASSYTSSDDVVFGATVTGRNAPVAGIEAMAGPTIATVPVRVRAAHVLADDEVQIIASFDRRAIEPWQVDKMLRQFSFVMQQLATADAEAGIASIDTLTPEDRQQLWEWNHDVPPAIERCIHDLFADQAKARPDAPAICAWDGDMTYGELDVLSGRLAGHLVELGVGPEDIVPLCFEKSMWTVVAMLAVLKAGGAFLLLDPSLPHERLRLMCRKVSAKLSSIEASAPLAKDLVGTVVIVNADSALQLAHHASPITSVRPTHTAYVIFTSGSGRTKGCRIEHRAASSAVTAHGRYLGMQASTRTLQFASYAFAGSLVELLMNLCHGAVSVSYPKKSEEQI
ncbi:hypothetical protein P3342_007334 [Pyrenophora teres f. teres]|nr:hypothetical protein P3342_007334 [Pyrenophora teres f. teres]